MEKEIWPEVVTTKEWRAEMTQARKAAGLTQEQLGTACGGVSQNAIAKLESGASGASALVVPVCLELGIAPPVTMFGDALLQRFATVGYAIRRIDPATFELQIAQLERTLQLLRAARATPGPANDSKVPPGKKR